MTAEEFKIYWNLWGYKLRLIRKFMRKSFPCLKGKRGNIFIDSLYCVEFLQKFMDRNDIIIPARDVLFQLLLKKHPEVIMEMYLLGDDEIHNELS
jgi:hypothetical protein